MQKILTLSLILLLGIGLSACQSQKKIDDIAEVEEWNPTGLSGDEGAESTLSASGLVEGDSGDTLAGVVTEDFEDPLSKRVVYFEFDSIMLTPEGTRIVEAHAEYLENNRDMALVLEGHADERGTREYNLALGESRAKAVAEVFLGLGVSEDAIRIISYGEERPVDLEQSEDAWSLNRRVEILY
jgi:peptidoglycan-associated lipoprotein